MRSGDIDPIFSVIVEGLKARDESEHLLDAIISDYELLHEAYRAARKRALQLRHDLDGLRQRPSLLTDIAPHNLDSLSDEKREWLKSVEKSVVQLQEELSRAYSVIGERDRALAASHKQQQEDEDHIAKLQSDAASLEEKLAAAGERVLQLDEENERLKQNSSRRALEERCHILEEENQNLLARVKEASYQRAEAMNEMNDIVQRSVAERALVDVTDSSHGNSNEESCRIIDPVAWANMFKDG